MCGIIGYVGRKNAVELLFSGLKRLEYRGYDSAGVALIVGGRMTVFRRAGKVDELSGEVLPQGISARVGIGHTRWATHGPPTEENAHPHLDCRGKIAVVHNGIIENFRPLRDRLIAAGHSFRSQTDTEVLAHLIEEHDEGDILAAVQAAVRELEGAFALAVLSEDDPDRIIVARMGSPLIIGKGDEGNFVSSDIPAILGEANEVAFLEDGEIAEVRRDGLRVFSPDGTEVAPRLRAVTSDPFSIQKGGYKHFMLKEIHEQPRAVGETVREKLAAGRIAFPELPALPTDFERVYLVACGTAYHAGLVAEYQWEELLGVPVHSLIASEFRYRAVPVGPRTLVVAVSQSGETVDTLMAVRRAKEGGARVIGVLNTVGSAIEREADGVAYTRAGIEIGVAATKTFTAQLALLSLLGLRLAAARGRLDPEKEQTLIDSLTALPSRIAAALSLEPAVAELAERFYTARDFLFLGRGPLYPIALEGALKLKEISYIHAEGYPAGEMKHGPIALIDERMPVVVLVTGSFAYEKVLSNIEEVKARNGIVIALTDRPDDPVLTGIADHVLPIPASGRLELPAVYTVPLQLLAYHIAVRRGTDVDQPRNLAKTVTVE